jgi:hypothetical protein
MRQDKWGFQMSDWEVYQGDNESPQATSMPTSDWETLSASEGKPSFGEALKQAPGKIAQDVYAGLTSAAGKIPEYYQAAKTEIPGAFDVIKNHPGRAASQATAGVAELGKNVFNSPHDLINYLSQRLNLVPENVNQMVQMGRMPEDTQQMINQTFGTPQQPGEALIRGIPRNALNVAGGLGLAKALNPMRFTAKGIANIVLKETERQVEKHSNLYDKIWQKADKSGFNQVPFDSNIVLPNAQFIEKFYPEKSTFSLKNLISNPTLENAQKAQSDLGNLRRSIEEKAKTTPLLESENMLYKSLSETEKHIEDSMFKNAAGETNNALKNRYDKVTNSYRKNVVPYRYNEAIQQYKAEKSTAPELVNALSRGEFARKKGFKHPAIKINKAMPYLGPAAVGLYLGKELFGNNSTPPINK